MHFYRTGSLTQQEQHYNISLEHISKATLKNFICTQFQSWSKDAARSAQQWAEQCMLLTHDNVTGRWVDNFGSCGQNIFVSTQQVPWWVELWMPIPQNDSQINCIFLFFLKSTELKLYSKFDVQRVLMFAEEYRKYIFWSVLRDLNWIVMNVQSFS
jgi:hypothetical protein